MWITRLSGILLKTKTMKPAFHIPLPCHEDWDQMTPEAAGRNCAQCCETVIDFTGWEADAIEAYLFSRRATRVCGRIDWELVNTNPLLPSAYLYQVMVSGLGYLKKIAAIILFALCLSHGAQAQQTPQKDTVRPMIMGKMLPPPQHPQNHPKPNNRPKPQRPVTGMVAPVHHPTPPTGLRE